MTEPTTESCSLPPPAASLDQVVGTLAWDMAADGFARGDLAELRRMDPDDPDASAFWRLMARHDLLGSPAVERKWALILHGIALMTRTTGTEPASRSAHDGTTPVGRALFFGGNPERTNAFYSESRLNRLLTARGPVMHTLLARTFRMLGTVDQSFDWREMARMILSDERSASRVEGVRRSIANAYYLAEHRSQQRRPRETSS